MKHAYSSVKIFHHKDALDKIERGEVCPPLYIRIKPTNYCNHHCAYCTYGSGNTQNKTKSRDDIHYRDQIPWEKMKEIIGDIGNMGVKAVTFSGGGEPLAYPHIAEAAEKIAQKKIDLSLITNGQLLDGARAEAFFYAKWVRISFDSPNAQEYAKLRGVTEDAHQAVLNNIAGFAQKKKKNCILGINYVVSAANYKRIYEAARLLKELGADNVKFSAMLSNEKGHHDAIREEAAGQISRAKADFASDAFSIIGSYENECRDVNFSAQSFPVCYTCRFVTVIAADQKIYLCHTRAYDSKAVIADFKDRSFREAWTDEQTQQKLLRLDPQWDCNNFCVYEDRNRMIQAYFDVNQDHVNFI